MSAEVVRPLEQGGELRLRLPGPWRSVGQRLRHLATATPDALALASAGSAYSYGEMMATAEAWARSLRRRTAALPSGQPVALEVEPDARCAVALLACVLSGRPVIPLDPMLPAKRIDQILDTSGAWRIDVDALAALPASVGTDVPDADLDDPAVIFYTSGSTGRPKGLVHTHGCWLNQAVSWREAIDMEPSDRNALILPLSFGGGLDVLFMSVLNGASAHVHDPRMHGLDGLLGWLRDGTLTAVHATPSMLRSILEALAPGEMLDGLRIFSTCGEAIHASQVERLRQRMHPGSRYVGLSGASEIGFLAYYSLPFSSPVPPGIVPVGRPGANKDVQVIGPDGLPLRAGVTGEVSITSRFLSLGYFNDPEMTAERFRRNPDGTTTYRGGDLGQWDTDGVLHLKGRADAAVKIGAYLVEPAEVEAALMDSPEVLEAVVSTVREVGPTGEERPVLVAHVVPVQAERSATPASVRRSLRERLPTWMVPTRIVMMAELPRTERGKIDRLALPPAHEERAFVPARTVQEKLLAGVWRAVLGLDEVPADVDFWELGADSLAVEQVIVGVRRATGTVLGSADLTRAPTIEKLAVLLGDRGTRSLELPATAVQLREGKGGPPVFAFAGGGAAALSLLPIAMDLQADVPVYGFQASGYEGRGRPDWSLGAVVERHLRVIRKVAPEGPHVLVGHSFGGLLALEAAARLAAEGKQVPLVVLLDTMLPDPVTARGRALAGAGAAPAPEPPVVPPAGERLLMHARLLGAGVVRYSPAVRDAVFWEQSLRMINRHRVRTWSGHTLVFTAPGNTDDPTWWDLVLTGDHEVLPIDGGHSSILRAPFHQPIVERLGVELAALG